MVLQQESLSGTCLITIALYLQSDRTSLVVVMMIIISITGMIKVVCESVNLVI